ncbi:MAG: hypothetical protein M9894_01665 [Planctomycetes bacterium]|nr:hypothetical protein [Planctomycetota bacterium]
MSLFDKVKALFSRASLPEETRLLLTNVKDVEELRAGLDQIATQNEVEAREIERDIEKLGRMEAAHKERVLGGGLSEREKMSALREIRRLRRRMDSLEKRHRIHQDNIDLHLGLFDRITEMQAMELKRVNQGQIEEIAVDYEEKLEKHRDIMNAAKVAHGMDSVMEDSAERRALADLEREILAEARADEVETTPVEEPDEEEVDRELEAIEREVMAARAAARAQPVKAPEPRKVEAAPKEPAAPERPRRRSIEEELAELDAQEPEDDEDEGREATVE